MKGILHQEHRFDHTFHLSKNKTYATFVTDGHFKYGVKTKLQFQKYQKGKV